MHHRTTRKVVGASVQRSVGVGLGGTHGHRQRGGCTHQEGACLGCRSKVVGVGRTDKPTNTNSFKFKNLALVLKAFSRKCRCGTFYIFLDTLLKSMTYDFVGVSVLSVVQKLIAKQPPTKVRAEPTIFGIFLISLLCAVNSFSCTDNTDKF